LKKPLLRSAMTDRNRSFSAAFGIVTVLIAVLVFAAALVP